MQSLLQFGLFQTMRWYCRARGFRVYQCRSDRDRERHDGLVREQFFRAGFFASPETPLLEEAPGSCVESFLAVRKCQPVGAISIVTHPAVLPVESMFNISIPGNVDRKQLGEITRLVIDRNSRQPHSIVSRGLLHHALIHSRRQNIRWWVWVAPSMFLWGIQSSFATCRILPQKEPTSSQRNIRAGRESFFDSSRNLRVVLLDTHSIRVNAIARQFARKQWQKGTQSNAA